MQLRLPLPKTIYTEFSPSPRNVVNSLKDSEKLRRLRTDEFELGRRLARNVLLQAGLTDYSENGHVDPEIKRNADRSPAWPTGFVGSISHSDHWVWVAVANDSAYLSMGVDTEVVVDQARSTDLHDSIGSQEDWHVLSKLGLQEEQSFTLLFSAKESFFKCWYHLTKMFLEFNDIELVDATLESLGDLNNQLLIGSFILKEKATAERVLISGGGDKPPLRITNTRLKVHFQIDSTDVFTITWLDRNSSF